MNATRSLTLYLAVIMVTAALLWKSASARVPFRHNRVWHSPCSAQTGTTSVQLEYMFQNIGEPDAENLDRYEEQLIEELNFARITARRLGHHIRRHHLFTRLLIRPCEIYSFRALLGTLHEEAQELTERDVYNTLPHDYERLTTLAVFISEVAADTTIRYQWRLDSLLVSIRKSMCLMEIIALSHQLNISHDVTERVMPEFFTDVNDRAERDRRNCIIVRDAAEIFENIHERYAQLLTF